ncbi:MAG TPA: hypothetical protein VJU61_18090, partial [Polyangiaceae bacterium]|nr:hypothetical protein [Polyangiaceae bacterium]
MSTNSVPPNPEGNPAVPELAPPSSEGPAADPSPAPGMEPPAVLPPAAFSGSFILGADISGVQESIEGGA